MIAVLRKVAQLNIKYRKNGGPIIDVCTGAPSDKVTALSIVHLIVGLFWLTIVWIALYVNGL